MTSVLWMVWTFVLGALPSSFSGNWLGPIITGPSDMAPVLLALAVLLLAASIGDDSLPVFQSKWFWRLVVGVGVVAASVWAALIVVSYIYFHSLEYELSEWTSELCFNLMGLLRTPAELLALVGWASFTLHHWPVDNKAPFSRNSLLFLGGALWPCLLMSLGFVCSVSSIFSEYDLDLWGLAACLVSGVLLSGVCARMARVGIRLMDLVSLLAGFVLFRAAAEVAEPFLWTFDKSSIVAGLLALAYLLVTGTGCVALWLASKPSLSDNVEITVENNDERKDSRTAFEGLFSAVSLTVREREVILDTLEGLTSRQIAEKYELTVSTVGTYRRRAYEKLGVAKKKELVELVAQASARSEGQSDEGEADRYPVARERGLSSTARAIAGILTLVIILLVPLDYIPLSIPPYGLRIEKIAPCLIGASFLVGGVARWLHIQNTDGLRADCSVVERAVSSRDAVLRKVTLALGVVATGWLLSSAWLSPFPGLEHLMIFFDWLSYRIWAVLGIVVVLASLGAFYAWSNLRINTAYDALNLLEKGMEELLLRRPYFVVLLGVGIQLFSIRNSFFSADIMVFERFLRLSSTIPYVLILLLLGLTGVRLFRYQDQFDGKENDFEFEDMLKRRGLSDLQARVVVLSLKGKTSDEIAATLYLAPGTVRVYRSRVCKLMGVKNLSELVQKK